MDSTLRFLLVKFILLWKSDNYDLNSLAASWTNIGDLWGSKTGLNNLFLLGVHVNSLADLFRIQI